MKQKNIDFLFVYFNGRQKRLNEGNDSPKEFFYGYHYIKEQGFKVDILEFGPGEVNKVLVFIMKFIQNIIIKIFKFQYDFAGILRAVNFKKIKSSKNLIITNTRIGHSLLPFIIYCKIFKKELSVTVFAMGMFNSSSNRKIILKIHKFLHTFLIKYIDHLLFIGQKEYSHAINEFNKYKDKIQFLPFGIDYDYWSTHETKSKDFILFIGNDSNRDFEFLEELISETPNKDFVVVSEQFISKHEKFKNLELIKGSWNKNILNDDFLKNLYKNAKFTIIPLKNSFQPSGQSVALQSMSMKTPVIITNTDGFWDSENFKHKENIIFVESNNIKDWSTAMYDLENDHELYKKLQENAQIEIHERLNCNQFGKKLLEIIRE